jgi:hypothetical protein
MSQKVTTTNVNQTKWVRTVIFAPATMESANLNDNSRKFYTGVIRHCEEGLQIFEADAQENADVRSYSARMCSLIRSAMDIAKHALDNNIDMDSEEGRKLYGELDKIRRSFSFPSDETLAAIRALEADNEDEDEEEE